MRNDSLRFFIGAVLMFAFLDSVFDIDDARILRSKKARTMRRASRRNKKKFKADDEDFLSCIQQEVNVLCDDKRVFAKLA